MINVKEIKKEFLMFLLDKPIKKVLDLGCGKGLMSRFFTKKAKVIGIDTKKIIEDIENFEFREGDIRQENFGKENDLIIASLTLHIFNKNEAQKIIERMKQATSDSGYNLLICVSDEDTLAKKNQKKFYPSVQELLDIYKDWNLLKTTHGVTKIEEHGALGPHNHNLIFVLFKK
jgi:SAM-dependent methyltransferase